MYKRYRIEELYPSVELIIIRYKREYLSAFGLIRDKEFRTATYQPSFEWEFVINCINRDCTWNKFNLDSEVSSMAARRETFKKGKLRCMGNEAKDHSNECPCVMEYEIEIEYRTI